MSILRYLMCHVHMEEMQNINKIKILGWLQTILTYLHVSYIEHMIYQQVLHWISI